MGEAHHLSSAERSTLIRAAREALDAAGLNDVPIIAGTGLAGTRVTIELTREAAAAGADYAIVISAGYFVGALDKTAQRQLFTDVADASPIPVLIYNCTSQLSAASLRQRGLPSRGERRAGTCARFGALCFAVHFLR